MTQPRRVAAVSLAKRVARCKLKAFLQSNIEIGARCKPQGFWAIFITLNCSQMGSEVGEVGGLQSQISEAVWT